MTMQSELPSAPITSPGVEHTPAFSQKRAAALVLYWSLPEVSIHRPSALARVRELGGSDPDALLAARGIIQDLKQLVT